VEVDVTVKQAPVEVDVTVKQEPMDIDATVAAAVPPQKGRINKAARAQRLRSAREQVSGSVAKPKSSPVGSAVAHRKKLVRQAILTPSNGKIVASPIGTPAFALKNKVKKPGFALRLSSTTVPAVEQNNDDGRSNAVSEAISSSNEAARPSGADHVHRQPEDEVVIDSEDEEVAGKTLKKH